MLFIYEYVNSQLNCGGEGRELPPTAAWWLVPALAVEP
jgi:hypothetical protein